MKSYTTSRGVNIDFLPISRETLLRFRAANPEPKPPTYDVLTGLGIKETHVHDKTTVQTLEERAALEAYEQAQAQYTLHYLRFFVLRGLEIHATIDDWLAEQSFIGLPRLDNKAEERFEWITNCVLATSEDYKAVMLGVIEASGVPEDLLLQIDATFHGQLQGTDTQAASDSRKDMDG